MKRAFFAVATAAATLSIASLAVATATSQPTWTAQSRQDFSTFSPDGARGLSLDSSDIAAANATDSPTSARTTAPTATPSPSRLAIKRPAAPSLPPAGAGTATSQKVLWTPSPRPIVQAPAPVSGSPTVADAQAYALGQIGSAQYSCLYQLWMRESGWNPYARNASSGAYGIPQALPGYKMATAGADWATNPVTQVKWGLGYVAHYGGACAAWSFWQAHGWY